GSGNMPRRVHRVVCAFAIAVECAAELRMTGLSGKRIIESCRQPGSSRIDVVTTRVRIGVVAWIRNCRTKKTRIKDVHRTYPPTGKIDIRDIGGICSEIPVVQGQLRIDLAEQPLKALGEFPVPGKDLRPSMYMRRLVYFVLLEPPAHAARRCVASDSGVKA